MGCWQQWGSLEEREREREPIWRMTRKRTPPLVVVRFGAVGERGELVYLPSDRLVESYTCGKSVNAAHKHTPRVPSGYLCDFTILYCLDWLYFYCSSLLY